ENAFASLACATKGFSSAAYRMRVRPYYYLPGARRVHAAAPGPPAHRPPKDEQLERDMQHVKAGIESLRRLTRAAAAALPVLALIGISVAATPSASAQSDADARPLRIGIIGTGRIGGALARYWA